MKKISIPESELYFTFSRSGGAGGQNVNKVNSKVLLRWNIRDSLSVSEYVKIRFFSLYPNAINENGEVVIVSQEERSQKDNVRNSLEKLKAMLEKCSFIPKIRRKTKPKKSSVEKRIQGKKKQGALKKGRNQKNWND